MKTGPKPIRPEPVHIQVDGCLCVKIPLTRGMWALVDLEDAPAALKFFWIAAKHSKGPNTIWYAARRVRKGEPSFGIRQFITLHKFLLPVDSDVDHRNGDGLDCRRCNLRSATESQNLGNSRLSVISTSGFKGVTFRPAKGNRRSRWCARIGEGGNRKQLGSFQNPIEAAKAYNAAAFEKWGEFARLNPIP